MKRKSSSQDIKVRTSKRNLPISAPKIAEICRLLAAGESVRNACAIAGENNRDLYAQLATDDAVCSQVARAREIGQVALADQTLDIADDADPQEVEKAKLRIWARQWHAAKVAPKKYGEKLHTEISGADGSPLVIQWHVSAAPALLSAQSQQALPPSMDQRVTDVETRKVE